MKKILIASIMAMASALAVADTATGGAAKTSAAVASTESLTIGEMIDNPSTRAILDKYLPGFSSNEQISMARGMTLKAVQPFAQDQITDEALHKIDADLAKLSK